MFYLYSVILNDEYFKAIIALWINKNVIGIIKSELAQFSGGDK